MDPVHGLPGDRITLVGSGFVVGGTTVTVGGATVPADVQGPTAPLASIRASIGQTLRFTVPAGATTGLGGLTVTTDFGSAVAAFTVDAVGATPTTAPSSTTSTSGAPVTTIPAPNTVSASTTSTAGVLPYTGADSRGPLLVGLALVVGGGVLLIVRRRLRT